MTLDEFIKAFAAEFDETPAEIFKPETNYRKLDEWVHRKAIQKAAESYRISDEHKEYLKSLR